MLSWCVSASTYGDCDCDCDWCGADAVAAEKKYKYEVVGDRRSATRRAALSGRACSGPKQSGLRGRDQMLGGHNEEVLSCLPLRRGAEHRSGRGFIGGNST